MEKDVWYVIVNPHAGSKKTQEDWPKIKSLLTNKGIQFESVFTEYILHATKLTIKAITEKGYRRIISVGGDGTLNEIVNGVFTQTIVNPLDITVGVISVGTGNDWGRMYDLPSTYDEQIDIIKTGKIFKQDVGKVSYFDHGSKKDHFFINIAGIGYDALVAKKTNVAKQKGASGVLTYMISLVGGLFQYNFNNVVIEKEGKRLFSGKIFSVSVGICKYNGGGIMQLPNAISDDGLFDMTIIRKVSKFKVVRNITKLYDGTFTKIKEVEMHTGKQFTITGIPKESVFLETDGESLGNSPLVFNILEKSIAVIVK